MLDQFKQWFDDNESSLKERGLTVNLVEPDRHGTDKYGMYADIDSPAYIARVAIWNTGECDMEILSIDNGETIFWENYIFQNARSLYNALDDFVSRLI